MKFEIALFLQVVFIAALCVVQLNCHLLDTVDEESGEFVGKNLMWIYENKGEQKFMHHEGTAYTNNYGYLFTFTKEFTGTNHVSIFSSTIPGTYYWMVINSKFELSYTTSESLRTKFQIELVPGFQTKFYIKYNSNENTTLITRGGSDPIIFSLKYIFPNEDKAEFYLIPPSIEASYDGKLENIIPTVKRIREGGYGDKSSAYKKLLTAMEKLNHNLEAELFTVAIYMINDLGVDDSVFQDLPSQIKLIVSGEPLALYYKRSTALNYTMKYEKADIYGNILPYMFTYSNISDYWAISNIGSVSDHQLFVENTSPFYLSHSATLQDKEYVFKFKLDAELQHFNVFNKRNYPFVTIKASPPFTFLDNSNRVGAAFYVENFTSELEDENSKMCASGYVQCNYE